MRKARRVRDGGKIRRNRSRWSRLSVNVNDLRKCFSLASGSYAVEDGRKAHRTHNSRLEPGIEQRYATSFKVCGVAGCGAAPRD